VAVREGNDILGINACNGTITPIRYLRDPDTPKGKANIHLLYDGYYSPYYMVGSFLFEFNDFSGFSLLLHGCRHFLNFVGQAPSLDAKGVDS